MAYNMMSNQPTFLERLSHQLDELLPIIDLLMDNSVVYYHDSNGRHGSVISIGAPVNHYSKKDERTQILAREKYLRFLTHVELILKRADPLTIKKTKEVEKRLNSFIAQEPRSAPRTTEGGKLFFRKQAEAYRTLFGLFQKDEPQQIIVPETNALLQYPDPITYRSFVDGPFTFLLLPTVLSELDKLKVHHRTEGVRDKAKAAIRRFKGYRTQGDVLAGVTIDRTITVRMVASEPALDTALPWLDPANNDDRIVASVLGLQVQHPADRILLVTSDINLQNKAQAALLSFADTDDLEDSNA